MWDNKCLMILTDTFGIIYHVAIGNISLLQDLRACISYIHMVDADELVWELLP